MIRTPKATRSLRLRTGLPTIRAFLAERAARRRRQAPTRGEPDLAALIRRRDEKRKDRES
jgi:hypothetical protein